MESSRGEVVCAGRRLGSDLLQVDDEHQSLYPLLRLEPQCSTAMDSHHHLAG